MRSMNFMLMLKRNLGRKRNIILLMVDTVNKAKMRKPQGIKKNCNRRGEQSDYLLQMGNEYDVVGLPASKRHKNQKKAKKHKRKWPENLDSKVETVSEGNIRIEECGKPTRLTEDQENTITAQSEKCKRKRRKEAHDLGGKVFHQHDDLCKTNLKKYDDNNVNLGDTNQNPVGSSIKSGDKKCHERLLIPGGVLPNFQYGGVHATISLLTPKY